jgi:tetratricopeptide (TPR) repeat protein
MANNTSTIEKRRKLRLKAFKSYQQALSHNPNLHSASFRIGVLLNGNRQFKEAIRYLKNVLSAQPNHLRALIQISAAYEHLKMEKNALKYLEMGFKLAPNNKTILHKIRLLSASS